MMNEIESLKARAKTITTIAKLPPPPRPSCGVRKNNVMTSARTIESRYIALSNHDVECGVIPRQKFLYKLPKIKHHESPFIDAIKLSQ
jgi:hypothetical protein